MDFTPGVIPVAARGSYADGAYTGPAVDAYYGLVQIKAIVQGGRLVGIKVLQYPSDRRTSVMINRQALPMLRDEVVQRAKCQRRHHFGCHADQRGLRPLDQRSAEAGEVTDARHADLDGNADHGRSCRSDR